ncbi:hypothetical protein B0H14DRAFT_780087 [Mycena olivaceomarginata]|nr:hypothetical protein B0H14DRAFT_780087 [Mycena olivaceomarginata]
MRKRELGTGGSPSANTRSRRAVQKKERSPVVLNPCPRHEAKHSAPGIQCLSNDDISDAKVEPDTTPPTSPRRNLVEALRSRVHLGDGGGPHLNSSHRRTRKWSHHGNPGRCSIYRPNPTTIPLENDSIAATTPDSRTPRPRCQLPHAKRRKTLNVATSDSDDHTPRKRIRRREPNVDDSHSGSQGGDDRVSTADSADVDDLELSPPPSPSKPTAKERKRVTMDEYKNARENRSSPNKSSPISTRRTKVEETSDSDELAWGSDTSSSDSDTGSEGESSENMGSFIVDDSEKTEDPDADGIESARGPEYYARRKLSEQFTSFVEYLVRFYLNPDLLSTVSDNDSAYTSHSFSYCMAYCDLGWSYQAAIKAMRIRTEGVAESMQVSTWSIHRSKRRWIAVPFLLALTLASPWIARHAGHVDPWHAILPDVVH